MPGGTAATTVLGHRLREGHSFMLHITCDGCGKELVQNADHRYVVKMEVFAAHTATLTEADLDDDHLEAVSQLLRAEEDNGIDPDAESPQYKNFRFDLCPECHKKFVRDPLGKEAAQKFDFSEN
jgi:hypothetical protein